MGRPGPRDRRHLGSLSMYAGASVALAQTATSTVVTTHPIRAAEFDWVAAGSALVLLVGVVAIVRGRRSG